MSSFEALFPPTRWDSEDALHAQLDKVREEVDEFEEAFVSEGAERALEEACDVMVSASGLVRVLSKRLGTTPEAALAMVAAKNAERGYLTLPRGAELG